MARFFPGRIRGLLMTFWGTAYSSGVPKFKVTQELDPPASTPWGSSGNSVGQNQNPLSTGSTFILLTTLLLALLFHPFNGSLIYGPSLRLWIAAPTSIAVETGIIVFYVLRILLLKWKATYRYGDHNSSVLSFRNELYCLVVARKINTIDGNGRYKLRTHDAKALKLIKRSMKDIHEGWRVRLAIVLPIIAQYIKIMAVSGPGTLFLRVLGTLYVTHWIILEILLLTAQTGEDSATISRVKELMPPLEHGNGDWAVAHRDTPECTLIYEPLSYIVHQIGFVICSLTMIYYWSGHVFPLLLVVIMPWIWLAKTGLQLRQRACAFATAVDDRIDWKEAMISLSFGGPSVGPDIGCIFFVFWILYCICVYDSSSTLRPQWPWLDWLG